MLNSRFGFIPAVVIIFTPTEDKGVLDSFSLTSTKHVSEITETDWKGRNFSDSVWNNTDKLAQEIKQVLIEGELTGKSEADMAAKIVERFEVGVHAARRVVRTESNYCINQAELKDMKAAGFDEYEFISLGEEADNVCRVCDDLDGQRFKIADAVMAYSPIEHGIFINKNVLKNADTLAKYTNGPYRDKPDRSMAGHSCHIGRNSNALGSRSSSRCCDTQGKKPESEAERTD